MTFTLRVLKLDPANALDQFDAVDEETNLLASLNSQLQSVHLHRAMIRPTPPSGSSA
jgi:hypothetical protein